MPILQTYYNTTSDIHVVNRRKSAFYISIISGYFWHVTDMHWDPTYATDSKGLSCGPDTTGTQFGRYGDFRCDPPYLLLESAIQEMHHIKSDVDFLIWTGYVFIFLNLIRVI
jgi:sphingomyelin phosphodiesterase acid-like 3